MRKSLFVLMMTVLTLLPTASAFAQETAPSDGSGFVLALLGLILLLVAIVAIIGAVGLGIIGIGYWTVTGDDD